MTHAIQSHKITILYHDGEKQIFETPEVTTYQDKDGNFREYADYMGFHANWLTFTYGFAIIEISNTGERIAIPTENIKRITTKPLPKAPPRNEPENTSTW